MTARDFRWLDGVRLGGVRLGGVRLGGVRLDGVRLDGVRLGALALGILGAACAPPEDSMGPSGVTETLVEGRPGHPRVLVLTRTEGFRHDSIPHGVDMLVRLARDAGYRLTHSESAEQFPELLSDVEVVVFLNTTGDVLDTSGEAAFEQWLLDGGAFVGIHAAADTEYSWPFYGEVVGGYFASHPPVQPATIHVEDPAHPATSHLPALWQSTDEWYDFASNPRERGAHILLTVDEATYTGGMMGEDHPLAWTQELGRGRSFYTALGHDLASYASPEFVEHVRGGLEWALQAR